VAVIKEMPPLAGWLRRPAHIEESRRRAKGIAAGLLGRGGSEVLGHCGEFEVDGVERAVFGGDEIADHGNTQI
jgi:hypothetical protein